MSTFQLIKKEFRKILGNRFFIIAILAVTIVPMLYSLLYLDAFWDPYKRLDNLPVAVVNLDKGDDNHTLDNTLGARFVDNLKENHDVKWIFTDEKDAMDGLEGDNYYSVFVIPEDFTMNTMSGKNSSPKKVKLIYANNEKKNFLASQINSRVEGEIKDKIEKSISREYLKTAFDSLYDVKAGMNDAYDGSKKVTDGISVFQNKTDELSTASNALHDGSSELHNGINLLDKNMNKLAAGSFDLRSGLNSLNLKVPEIKDAVNLLKDGSFKLSEGSDNYISGLSLYSDKSKLLSNGSKKFMEGLSSLSNKMPEIVIAQEKIQKGTDTLNSNMEKLKEGSKNLENGLEAISSKLPEVEKATNEMKDGSARILEGEERLAIGSSKLSTAYEEKILPSVNKLSQGADLLDDKLKGMDTVSERLTQGSDSLSLASQKIKSAAPALSEAISDSSETMTDIADNLTVAIKNNPSLLKDPNIQKVMGDLKRAKATSQSSQGQIDTLINGIEEYSKGASQFSEGANKLTSGISDLKSGVNTLRVGLDNLNSNISSEDEGSFRNGLKSLNSGIATLNEGSKRLDTGISTLKSKMPEASEGIVAIKEGAKKLYGGLSLASNGTDTLKQGTEKMSLAVKAASDGTRKLDENEKTIDQAVEALSVGALQLKEKYYLLNEGTKNLDAGIDKFRKGVSPLEEGAQKLTEGSKKLSDGLSQAKEGTEKLSDGSKRLNQGTEKLAQSAPQFKEGATLLKEGSGKLTDGLKTGSEKLNNNLKASSKDISDFASEPVNVSEFKSHEVKNYGTGFSPYFIPLSLWVGGLMMFFVVMPHFNDERIKGNFKKVISKFSVYGFIGILQALLVSSAVIALGLETDRKIMLISFIILLSLVFIALIQLLITLFGDAGRIAAIVLLILQLTACAGTFPLELVPSFFRFINPIMPFTYAVEGLREIISGSNMSIIRKDVLILATVGLVSIIITSIFLNFGRKFSKMLENRKARAQSM